MFSPTVAAIFLLVSPLATASPATGSLDADPYGSINTSLLLIEHTSLKQGTKVTVWSRDDRQIGSGTVANEQVLLVVRGDDETTPDIVEGARPGDAVYLKAHPSEPRAPYLLRVQNIQNVLTGGTPATLRFQNDAFYTLTATALPDEFQLAENYPNPFTASTTISYIVPETATVTLDVFNALGQHVATLVDERRPPGEYTVTLDASELASGVYIYRLRAGTRRISRKMLVIR